MTQARRTNAPVPAAGAVPSFDQAVGLTALRWIASAAPVIWTLPQQVASRIGDSILDGTRAPGTWLREADLAREFGTSRGPVRDALRLLEREGLVRIHPRRGAQVTELSVSDVADLFEVRSQLFIVVARRLAQQRDPEYIDALTHAVRRMERLAPGDAKGYAEAVFKASLLSAAACGNDRVRDILTSLSLQMFRYTRLGLLSHERRKRSLALWKATLNAVRTGNVERAAAAAEARIRENGAEAVRRLEGATHLEIHR